MRRLILLVLAGLAACAKTTDPVARGRAVYASYDCKRCHRIGAEGGTTGPDLTLVGFRKSAEFLQVWLKDPSAWQPDTTMPNFHFSEASLRPLAAYLGQQKGQAWAGSFPWESEKDPVKRGALIYDKAGCVTCHGERGKGGYRNNNVIGGLVPALKDAADGFTKQELVKRISEGVARPVKADPKGPDPMLRMPAWKEVLRPEDIEAVAEYVLSLKPPGERDDW